MKRRTFLQLAGGAALAAGVSPLAALDARAASKTIVYLTPGLDLPFWRYLSKGVEAAAKDEGLRLPGARLPQQRRRPSSRTPRTRSPRASPASSSRRPIRRPRRAVLELAKKANIPVVIADIGTNSGDYVSFIISNNYEGAKGVGLALAAALEEEGLAGRLGRPDHHLAGAQERPGSHQGLPRRPRRGRRQDQGGRPAADAVLHRRRDLQVHAGHAHRQSRHARPVHPDRPAGDRRAARHQGRAARRRDPGRGLRRHSGVRRPPEVRPDRRLRHAAALSDGRALRRGHGRSTWPARRSRRRCSVPILAITSENIDKKLPTIKQTVFANEV